MTERPPDRDTEPATVYLDHGATSWPKPPEVVEAITDALTRYGGNPGRGAYRLAVATSRLIFESRRDCAALLGVADARDLFFLSGCTEGCNLMLKGVLRPGDRVVVGSMEHNAIARPLHSLAERGVDVAVVDADDTGLVDADRVEDVVREAPTRAVVCQHASNVTGTVQPVGDLADVAHAAGAVLLVDGAQGVGHLPVDLGALGADAYAVSGHKAMLGPQGIGLLYLAPDLEAEELLQGGTGGGASELPTQPLARPDRYEAGTPNTPGIAGIGAAARLLAERGAASRSHEAGLARRFHEGVLELGGYRVLGPPPDEERVPIVSVVPDSEDVEQIAFALDRRWGVAVRAGLHCAPWAHRTLGTAECGALRFGFGYGNTMDDVGLALEALRELRG